MQALCERLKVPSEHAALASIVCREHLNVHRFAELKPTTIHDLITRCDGFRKPERIARIALACEADKRGRRGREHEPYPARTALLAAHAAALAVKPRDLDLRGLRGEAIAPGDLALSCVLPILLVALLLWAIARRYANEAVLAGK